MNHLYLHGFASSPQSRKAVAVRNALANLNISLDAPDLNVPSFEHMTLTAMYAESEKRLRAPMVIWGSSLGGYLAAQLAGRNPKLVDRLVLMAPAIEFPASYPARASDAKKAWARNGTVPVFHHGLGHPMPLAGDLAADCKTWSVRPAVNCPTLVIAARNDDFIPLQTLEAWAAAQPKAELVVLDDEHDLLKVTPELVKRALEFLKLG